MHYRKNSGQKSQCNILPGYLVACICVSVVLTRIIYINIFEDEAHTFMVTVFPVVSFSRIMSPSYTPKMGIV